MICICVWWAMAHHVDGVQNRGVDRLPAGHGGAERDPDCRIGDAETVLTEHIGLSLHME